VTAAQGGAVRIKKVDGVQIHSVSGQYKAEQDRAAVYKEKGATDHKKEDHHRHLEDLIGEVRSSSPADGLPDTEPSFSDSSTPSARRCSTRWSSLARPTRTRCACHALPCVSPRVLTPRLACVRELRLGLKLHHKLCSQAVDRMKPLVEKYGEDETQAKTDVKSLVEALFPTHRLGSKQCVWSRA